MELRVLKYYLAVANEENTSAPRNGRRCRHPAGAEKALPDNAVVMDAFDVYRADIMQAQPKVHDWLRALGFAE